jgi:hypothetical protein
LHFAESLDRLTLSWDENQAVVANAIEQILSGSSIAEFKIGISVNVLARWDMYGSSYDDMHLLYFAKMSHPDKAESSGAMERAQIARFGHYHSCNNVARGGERPSAGYPHWVYLVTKESLNGHCCTYMRD